MGLAGAVVMLGWAASASAQPSWQVYELTSGTSLDYAPDVSGETIVWQRGAGSGGQIMKWSVGDAAPVAISDTDKVYRPRIEGTRILWYTNVTGGDYEIKQWLNGVVSTLTSNTADDLLPDLGGGSSVWLSLGDDALLFDDGSSSQLITAPVSATDEYPSVFDDQVAWYSGPGGTQEIYLWDAGVVTQLTLNPYFDGHPETDGQSVVWQGTPNVIPEDSEIFRWTPALGVQQLTSNGIYDVQADVSGDVVVFSRDDGSDYEIFMHYLGLDYQITDNDYDDFEPQVDGNYLAWEGKSNGGSHIYYAVLDGLDGQVYSPCCLDLDCQLLTESACTDLGGLFLTGQTLCDEDSCGYEPAGGWSTFQHDAQRTGRSESTLISNPNRLWTLVIGEDGFDKVAPTLSPDGTIYSGSYPDLVAVNSDGSVKWIEENIRPFGPAAIRRDEYFFIPKQETYGKNNPVDGSGLCGLPNASLTATALDAGGNSFVIDGGGGSTAWTLRKLDPGCSVLWTYAGTSGATIHVALDSSGDAHVSTTATHQKIDGQTGLLDWSVSTPTTPGAPAIGADDAVYFTRASRRVFSYNATGGLKWSRTLADTSVTLSTASPAIAPDGAIVVVGTYGVDGLAIVALNADGTERWLVKELGLVEKQPVAPVVDATGTILFCADNFVIALSSLDGSELWRVDVGIGDSISNPPAIAADGTFYLTTQSGLLVAYGAGCPEEVLLYPPYSYRTVVSAGDEISGYTIEEIDSFEVGEDGLASFNARVNLPGSPEAAFLERTDGGFDIYAPGTSLDGLALDSVHMPRRDDSGNVYLPAYVVNEGSSIFVNDQLVVREGPDVVDVAPITLESYENDFFDIDDAGKFLIYGQIAAGQETGVVSVFADNQNTEIVLAPGAVIDQVGSINMDQDPDRRRQANASGDWVAGDSDVGLVVNDIPIAVVGDVVDGYTISKIVYGQLNDAGNVYYLAENQSGLEGVFNLAGRVIGTGDIVDGQTISAIERFDANDDEQVAVLATLTNGRRAVFAGGHAVVVDELTQLEGFTVTDVDIDHLDQNDSGEVAFGATVNGKSALWVATPTGDPQSPFTYRRVMTEGLDLGGLGIVQSIRRFDLGNPGEVAAFVDISLTQSIAPLQVSGLGNLSNYTICENGKFLVSAQANTGEPFRLSVVDPSLVTLTPLFGPGDVVDGVTIGTVWSGQYEQRLLSEDGTAVAYCTVTENGSSGPGIMTQHGLVARDGDVIDAFTLVAVDRPEISPSGNIVFVGQNSADKTGLFTATDRLIGSDDIRGGHTIEKIYNGVMNDAGQVLAVTKLLGSFDGIFLDLDAVAVENETVVEVSPCYYVDTSKARLNSAGQVAFIARTIGVGSGNDALYVATPTGVPAAPFTYRRTAFAGEVINGKSVYNFEHFTLTESGLVGFYAKGAGLEKSRMFLETAAGTFSNWEVGESFAGIVSQGFGRAPYTTTGGDTYLNVSLLGVGTTVLVNSAPVIQDDDFIAVNAYVFEQADGSFESLVDGDFLNGLEVDFAAANEQSPRIDDDGDVYVYSAVAGVGTTLFRNGVPLVQRNVAGATAPVKLTTWYDDLKVFDVTDGDSVLLYGRRAQDIQDSLLLIDALAGTAEAVWVNGTTYDGWIVESIDTHPSDERHRVDNTRTFVVRGEGQAAVTIDENVCARVGQVVSGHELTDLSAPQSDNGSVVYLGHFSGGNGIFGCDGAVVSTGDNVDGYAVSSIVAHSSTSQASAFTATLVDGRHGVFHETRAVAIEGDTEIDGQIVNAISPEVVRQNAAGQVAFMAAVGSDPSAVYAATDLGTEWTYRRAAMQGQTIGAVNLDFSSGVTHCPRNDSQGGEYLSASTEQGFQTLFYNRLPIVMAEGPDAQTTMQMVEFDPAIFDSGNAGYFALAGRISAGDAYGVVVGNAITGPLTSAVSIGQTISVGAAVEAIEIDPLDGRWVNDSGDVAVRVLAPSADVTAIQGRSGPYAISGDTLGEYTLIDLDHPRIDDVGRVYFWAIASHAENGTGEGVFLADKGRSLGTGDAIGGETVDAVLNYDVCGDDTLAALVTLSGQADRMIAYEGLVVVREGQTDLGIGLADTVSTTALRANSNHQIAFVAAVSTSESLFVATPNGSDYDFRQVASVGDELGGLSLESIADFRLTEEGLARISSVGSTPALFIEIQEGVWETLLSGDALGGRMVDTIEDVRLDDNGWVSFRSAATPESTALYREVSEGSFDVLAHGNQIGELTLDFTAAVPFAPRVDPAGRELLFVPVDPVGMVGFMDRVPVFQPYFEVIPEDVLVIDQFLNPYFVDPAGDGTFLIYGRPLGSNQGGLLSVDPESGAITPVVSENQVIDGFEMNSISPAEVDGFGEDGVAVYSASDGVGNAVGRGTSVIARTGDVVDGFTFDDLDLPRRNQAGDVYYRADGNVYRFPLGGTSAFHRGAGDTVALQPLLSIEHYGVNDSGQLAYQAELLGQRSGVFVDETAVAIAQVTGVDGTTFDEVGYGNDDRVSLNNAGQVAFLGAYDDGVAHLFVASPALNFDGDGDSDVDLIDFAGFDECLTGPGEFIRAECQIYDANKDCHCDMIDAGLLQVGFTGDEP